MKLICSISVKIDKEDESRRICNLETKVFILIVY